MSYIVDEEGFFIDYVNKKKKKNKKLTSVYPKTEVGKWLTKRTIMHDGEYYCSKCNKDSPLNILYNYCPNCGAKMESEN